MAVLGSIVETFVRSMFEARSNLALGRAVGSELVGDEAFWCSPLPLHQSVQQTSRGLLVAPTLENFIQYNAVLIDGAPEPEFPAFDIHDNLVQMPNIAGLRLSTAQSARDGWTELCNPSSDGLVGNINPEFQKHLLDLAKTEVETAIQPNSVSDDRRWKTMTLVTD